ncbi:hypothetical protein KCP73_07415 [Salmonella enterica subsp. enterica]|nr:hypothetical protein KCP73_07415 [Salmonella enterica subsp. enterica]
MWRYPAAVTNNMAGRVPILCWAVAGRRSRCAGSADGRTLRRLKRIRRYAMTQPGCRRVRISGWHRAPCRIPPYRQLQLRGAVPVAMAIRSRFYLSMEDAALMRISFSLRSCSRYDA